MTEREIAIEPSTIEIIDLATYEWLDQKINIHSLTNKGWKKVPAIWVAAERAHNVKRKKELRDRNGAFILPAITLERTGMTKDLSRKGIYWAHVPNRGDFKGGAIEISRRIKQDKTRNFANATSQRRFGQLAFKIKPENQQIVYETASIPMPAYVTIDYKISLFAQYQQQMNEMVQPFITTTGGINYQTISKNGHKYELFVQENFTSENNISDLNEEERDYITNIEVKVLGHLIGDGANHDQPKIVIRENIVDIKIPRERVMVGDLDDITTKKIF